MEFIYLEGQSPIDMEKVISFNKHSPSNKLHTIIFYFEVHETIFWEFESENKRDSVFKYLIDAYISDTIDEDNLE